MKSKSKLMWNQKFTGILGKTLLHLHICSFVYVIDVDKVVIMFVNLISLSSQTQT